MNHYQFERSARINRQKALWLTVFIHLVLLVSLILAGNEGLKRQVMSKLGFQTQVETTVGVHDPDIRP